MTITINIKTDNAAFENGNKDAEVLRILREWLDRESLADARLRDYNGNKVGTVTVTEGQGEDS